VYCSVLQCVAVRCSVLQGVAVCYSVLQCVAVCCSVLPCVAVCCSVLQCVATSKWTVRTESEGVVYGCDDRRDSKCSNLQHEYMCDTTHSYV